MGRRIRQIAKLTLGSFLVLVLGVTGGGLRYRACRHHQLAKVTAIDPVNGIDEAFFITYVDSITAPQKQLVLIPNAGHNVIATKSDEFLTLLVQRSGRLPFNCHNAAAFTNPDLLGRCQCAAANSMPLSREEPETVHEAAISEKEVRDLEELPVLSRVYARM